MSTANEIERFIVDELLVGNNRTKLDHDKSLISSGILDSLALLQLIDFIQGRFDTIVEDDELLPENFETINSVTDFIRRKSPNGVAH